MDFVNLIKIVIGSLPFAALCLANSKINLHKANRSRQFLMPVVALVYSIIGLVLMDKINNALIEIFNWLGQKLPFMADIHWESVAIYVLNVILVVGFIIIKGILLPILNKIWQSNDISKYTSAWFYEYEDGVDKWLLIRQFANFRGYAKGFYFTAFIVSMVVFILSQHFKDSLFFQATFYPVFGIIVLGEVVFFLSGITKTEFVEDILGEDEESYKVANYGALREILRDLFPDRVLYENTVDTASGISTTFDELDEMTQSDDEKLKLIGTYYQNLKNSGTEIDINYVKSSINILNGKKVLVK